ncbi:MAG: glycosyltransferase family 4 protein [Chitinophagaceae bacterium]
MNIAFVSTYDAHNVSNWSGLGYYISKSLEDNGNNLQYLGNLPRKITLMNFLKKVYYTKIQGKQFLLERTVAMSKGYSAVVANRLSTTKADCVFSPGTLPVAYLKTDLPKVIFTDATFACLLNYYEPSSGLSSDLIRQGHEIEKQCLESCSLAIYSSEWAAQSAIQYYGISPSKVKVVPFGANFNEEYSEAEVHDFVLKRDNHVLKILFNGVNFKRKGGELVFAAVKEMEKRGMKVELHMVGIPVLPIKEVPHFVVNHGFLNKAVLEERALLKSLYQTCHFLFLPSKAEAFGCVFCEASSYGMPSITRETGGVSSAITNGVNGFVLGESATTNDYVDLICNYFLDRRKYNDLAFSSFNEYKSRLNWKSTGASLIELIKQL